MSMMLGQGARASGALAHALRGCAAVGKQQWAAPAAAAPVVAGATSTVFMSSSSSSSTPAKAYDVGDSTNIKWHEGRVDRLVVSARNARDVQRSMRWLSRSRDRRRRRRRRSGL